ncbi:MAG TPA: cell surface protein SprA [Saprospiraceae bacterium]|nr:cell surface protein SprA [Saprospiraceae bacterium]HMQ83829.1 cell surface protein SprA [Saprospiraceae bacterium]
MRRFLLPFSLLLGIVATALSAINTGTHLEDPYLRPAVPVANADTIPDIEERYDDFLNDQPGNPFDLEDPSIIEKQVEYDPETGNYIITEKIGDELFRPATYMSFQEYIDYQREQQEQDYFRQLSGASKTSNGLSPLDPLAKVDVKNDLIDRLFGGTTVDIRPQGNIDLTFGFDISRLENPILTERQRTTGGFDFDMDINMNATGKIGEKLDLTFNYNTGATFNFDNQIKLNYNSDLSDEDAIIKKIEAGTVSLPLRGSLIQGAQSLFGLKTELQFGHLRLTAIASQQKSQRENVQIEGGSQVQEFEVYANDYDENRHFFLTHYNRENFERGLGNLPQINSLFKIKKLEVWLTNDRNEVTDVRDIVALADLGEPIRLVSPDKVEINPAWNRFDLLDRKPLPDNAANDLYGQLAAGGNSTRDIDQAVSTLQGQIGLQQTRDFEKVRARKLQASEYTFHPELGFISVNINVQPDQVLAVAFEYEYNGNIFTVGDMSINNATIGTDTSDVTPKVLFVKMLKSTTQRTDLPTWDLMMKNVYSIGAFQVNQDDFRLDIFYDDPGGGQKRFLPSSNLAGIPLLRVFNLDRLNTQGDPQADGVFDFVPGVTINPRNGRIMFPVLEPFGSALSREITDPELRKLYVYDSLYATTVFNAIESAEQNRYIIRGEYKSSVSSEISLGAFNIPQGSVQVTGCGGPCVEGRDYEVDYSIGKVRILNDALLQSGVPINVSFEDNTLFGFQSKTMIGLRADYEIDENFNIGGTYLQLFERPFTQKVNVGDDPINNKIYGLDINLNREAPWLTKAVDAIPLISTTQPSSITVAAEGAALRPGHARAINQNKKDKGGVVYIDDFEGSGASFDLRIPTNQWYLASVPQNDDQNNNPRFPEANLINDLRSGANRARLNWYAIDQAARTNDFDNRNPYTSVVAQQEVFPNQNITPNQAVNFRTMDMTFYPSERGPYNFDIPGGYPGFTRGVSENQDSLILNDPATRWGGIMRELTTNDFQSANIEFLEFWVLSPFLDPEDVNSPSPNYQQQQGELYINLGNISEDILRDSRMFFENGLPGPTNPDRRVDDTNWGRIPITQQITRAFDNTGENRDEQDLGLDGLDNAQERLKFNDYINSFSEPIANKLRADPAYDDFRYFRAFPDDVSTLYKYRDFNNPEGNSASNIGQENRQTSTNLPDAEDLNRDNTLNETEAYFEYAIPLRADPLNPREIDMENTPFITDRREADNGRVWYRFRIPLDGPDKKAVGGIRDFRSIRFMRMYMRGFEAPTTLRFARLELVRNQWRRYRGDISEDNGPIIPGDADTDFSVDNVNIEENSGREPFNYVLPEGIQREQTIGVFSALQNEQALTMRIKNLKAGDQRSVFKVINMDVRVYERLKMFVHAEQLDDAVLSGEPLSIFVRLGSDFQNNYYEYEIPLTMSDPEAVLAFQPNSLDYKRAVWLLENEFDFALNEFVDLKKERNAADFSLGAEFSKFIVSDITSKTHRVSIKGNPTLGNVKIMMVGVRNRYEIEGPINNVEVWINELRLTGLDERGGAAAIGRVDAQLADFGSLTGSANISSIGFGAIDQKVQERNRESIYGYDLAASFNLDKFLPEKWGIRLPFYAQTSQTVKTPEFDPYDLDIRLKEKVQEEPDRVKRDSIKEQAQEVTQIKAYNFTNVRKERTNNNAKPMPWDISNFSLTYGYTETNYRDPIIESNEEKRYTGAIDYSYSRRPTYLQPFKNFKGELLKLIAEINLNPLPNALNVSSVMNRRFETTSYRFAGVDPRFNTFFNKRFTWDRDYDLQWDITKSLKFNFNATNSSVIDEPDEIYMLEQFPNLQDRNKFRRDSIWNNIKELGRPKNYQHNFSVNYNVPLKYLPFIGDFMTAKLQYQGGYSWSAAALNVDSLGNVIQNNQDRSANLDFNFEKLYDLIPYLKKINRGKAPAPRTRGGNTSEKNDPKAGAQNKKDDDKNKKDKAPSVVERVIVRPLLSLRRVRFNYSERFTTVVPGYLPQSGILGMTDFDSPGWDFVAGIQPRIREISEDQRFNPNADNIAGDWLRENEQWITQSVFLNQDVSQDYTQNYDARATIEPFKDFRIELEMTKTYRETFTETFKDTSLFIDQKVHAVPISIGSMQVSYFAMNTLFRDSKDEILELFDRFETNRVVISNRLGVGDHEDENLAEQGYAFGFGNTQQEVLLPAFIAAYTDEDPTTVNLDVFKTKPNVNWRLTYNGLSRVPLFANLFQNFSLTHGYKTNLSVSNFRSSLPYLRNRDQITGPLDTANFNFFPRLEISDVVIQESFAPLIAIDATLKNGMSFLVDYKKSRTLALSTVSYQLNETQSKEIVLGFGYLLRNVDIPFLTGSGKKKKSRFKNEEDAEDQQNQQNNRGGGRGSRGLQSQDLDINFDFSLRDDITYAHLLDQDIAEPTRGNYTLSISPSMEYQLNQRLSLRLFFDYRQTRPKTSIGYPRTDTSGGIVVSFQLN